MVLKKPTSAQYEALFGPLAGQIRVALALAFNDDGTPMFVDEASASYRKFCEVIEALKKLVVADIESGVFATKNLTCIDIFVREVEQLFAIADKDARFDAVETMVRAKLRLDGHALSDEEFDGLPYSDQIVAINKAVGDIVGDSTNPLTASAKV